jgi:Lysozyme like domain
MSTLGSFTDPLISPLQDGQSALALLVAYHRDAQVDLRALIDDLTAMGPPAERVAGVAADALRTASDQLIQMLESRLAVLEQLVLAMNACAREASWAVETVNGALLDEGLLEQLLAELQLDAVMLDGKNAVRASVRRLEQALATESASASRGGVNGAAVAGLGALPAALDEWGGIVYEAAQRLQRSIQASQDTARTLGRLSDPIDTLFQTPDLTASQAGSTGVGPWATPGWVGAGQAHTSTTASVPSLPAEPIPGLLLIEDAYRLATAAGFQGDNAITIVAIAMAESGLNPHARNTAGNTPPSTDRGILQFNSYWHREISDAQADDPAEAFRQAFRVTWGNDFHEWATFVSGAYQQYIQQVRTAVQPSAPASG